MTTPLAWGARVGPEFRARVIELCKRIGIPDPSWLMACMMFESGLDPARVNAVSGATGLIQFMPSTARGLGTTVEALAKMPGYEQLTWVERYLQPYTGRLQTLTDCYMAILYPIAIGKPDNAIVFARPSLAYEQNQALDTDHDGRVTKLEACAFVIRRLEEGLLPTNVASVYSTETQPAAPIEERSEPVQPTKEAPMGALALLQLFAPILSGMIPQIGAILKPDAKTQQYAGVAQVVLDTITKTTAQPNLQGAIEAMQVDPKLKTAVQEAVVTHPEVIGLMEVGSGGIGGARAAALQMQNADRPFWFNPAFWITVLLLVMPFLMLVDVFYVHPDNYQENLRTQIVTGVLAVIMIVGGYWLGSSIGSVRKTELSAQEGDKLK